MDRNNSSKNEPNNPNNPSNNRQNDPKNHQKHIAKQKRKLAFTFVQQMFLATNNPNNINHSTSTPSFSAHNPQNPNNSSEQTLPESPIPPDTDRDETKKSAHASFSLPAQDDNSENIPSPEEGKNETEPDSVDKPPSSPSSPNNPGNPSDPHHDTGDDINSNNPDNPDSPDSPDSPKYVLPWLTDEFIRTALEICQ